MKQFKDNDGCIYSLSQIIELNESEELLTAEELAQLDTLEVGEQLPVDMGEWIERIEDVDPRICRNCGKVIEPNEGYFHEVDEDHCDTCHSILYPDEKVWHDLCYDENGDLGDDYYYTE